MRNILKSINSHPDKVHLVQELNEDDPDRWVEYCEIMMDRIDRDPLFLESHTQYPQKINVCAGILNDTLIGPFFIDGNLNARAYEELLRNQIVPRIREITGDNFQNIWFQQD